MRIIGIILVMLLAATLAACTIDSDSALFGPSTGQRPFPSQSFILAPKEVYALQGNGGQVEKSGSLVDEAGRDVQCLGRGNDDICCVLACTRHPVANGKALHRIANRRHFADVAVTGGLGILLTRIGQAQKEGSLCAGADQ